MKAIRIVALAIIVMSFGFMALAQAPSGTRVNNSETVLMTNNTHTITLAQTTQPVTPTSLEWTFKTAGTSTFTFNYVRAGYTNIVLNRTITNCVTYVFFIPRDIKLVTADKLVFTKSRADDAQLSINWK